jgi:hypothetical protein
VLVVALALAGCAGASDGQVAAQAACRAYADTERHQVATTSDQADAVRARARNEAGRAAAEDDVWAQLQKDIDAAYAHLSASAAAHNADRPDVSVQEMEAYAAADGRVQDDCADADEDIGPAGRRSRARADQPGRRVRSTWAPRPRSCSTKSG